MPLTDLTPEEHQWTEEMFKLLRINAGGEEGAEGGAAAGGAASVDTPADFSQLEHSISELSTKSDILRNYKALSSSFKKLDKATQSALKAALAAIHEKDKQAVVSAVSALQKCVSEHSELISDAERTLSELSDEVNGLRQEYNEHAGRKAEFVKRAYFSKTNAKKLSKFSSACEDVSKELTHAEASVQARNIDDVNKALKTSTKSLQKLRKEMDWLDTSEASKSESKRMGDEKLQGNLTSDYDKKRESWRPQVCYNAAMKVGVIEGNLPEFMRASLMGENKVNGYPEGYPELMGISPETIEKEFDHTKVEESGVLNFVDDRTGHISHTAYLQKTDKGSVELYHTNCQTLDMALLGKAQNIPKAGLVTHYELSDPDTQNRFQEWLNKGYSFKHTPASDLK
ncbi:hypothetical protein SAMN04488518_101669 [Pseudovibrio ascidiaceicola]|uniref:DUF8038 domain-containing protein n=1 Tax=Pseudovibrio ascidiaceicola TaxID=285279 RepID=A0A1I3VWV3_9HYPH|nr:hypothetical protein [Pseudovibrio ascidiaceicola]SFJ99619.1 hypothetical protein SAMN04488518_101669 [Pseudovibrio ascidiaceicola]